MHTWKLERQKKKKIQKPICLVLPSLYCNASIIPIYRKKEPLHHSKFKSIKSEMRHYISDTKRSASSYFCLDHKQHTSSARG